ncbi:MAG TPA: hypothetical protein ENF34_00445, partial [Candidatus Bathyarchaeota archaeon]|nr:hypothetical protein [Candidatus Bathyarchaeota archaeon]
CETCAAMSQAGGRRQAEMMKMLLDLKFKLEGQGNEVEATSVLRQCDKGIVKDGLSDLVKDYDAILSMACGAGVQTVAEVFPDKPVLPACNTTMIGSHDREEGLISEFCKACGNCILHETGGICPLTRCAKGLLNGPCGGQAGGKCEVGGWTRDCAWVLIYKRLKEQGKLDLFRKFRPPRDWSVSQSPRQVRMGA